MVDITTLVRKNIRELKPYSCARDEFKGKEAIFLDANENPYDTAYNRYPDPLQLELKEKISQMKGAPAGQIFLGNGSDEVIDLLFRAFCDPRIDNVIIPIPTYGMYKVCADINDVEVREVPLLPESFQLDTKGILKVMDSRSKMVFICSPNNPTSNIIEPALVEEMLHDFKGIVVVDEAYLDFTDKPGMLNRLGEFEHLVIMQTFSKAWGMAGVRLGVAYASEQIINILNKIKPPYNINSQTQKTVMAAIDNVRQKDQWVAEILAQRQLLMDALLDLPFVEKIYPSDANFFVMKVADPRGLYNFLVEKGIVVRDRSTQILLKGAIRISVGTEKENRELIAVLKQYR